jgi:antitoxin component YwqK of YwqJK toxin-antitoxin module
VETEIKREYHENGKLMYEHSYVNGIRHGIQKWYYDNGLEDQFHMKNGQLYGIRQFWYKDGRRNFFQKWKNHQRNGPDINFNY